MSNLSDLRLVDPEADAQPAEPRVFVRTISAPPGLPWEQARAAGLEARMGAPLPLDGVAYQVKRLESWSPGRPARFAAFYVRAAEIGDSLTTLVEADGRPVQVRFVSEFARRRQSQATTMVAGAVGGVGLVLVLCLMFALGLRAEAAARLDAVEQRASARLNQAQKLSALKLQTRTLDGAQSRGRDLQNVLDDLALLSAAKTPGAHIQAFHWDRGYTAVEARGDTPPFGPIDRTVQRAEREVRPGVWLWGIAPPASRSPGATRIEP